MIAAGAAVVAPQTVEEATSAFHGVPPPNPATEVQKFGEPIPGYSGANRRIAADNVFGMTYAEARKMAVQSNAKVDQEKSETLRETSKWVHRV